MSCCSAELNSGLIVDVSGTGVDLRPPATAWSSKCTGSLERGSILSAFFELVYLSICQATPC